MPCLEDCQLGWSQSQGTLDFWEVTGSLANPVPLQRGSMVPSLVKGEGKKNYPLLPRQASVGRGSASSSGYQHTQGLLSEADALGTFSQYLLAQTARTHHILNTDSGGGLSEHSPGLSSSPVSHPESTTDVNKGSQWSFGPGLVLYG